MADPPESRRARTTPERPAQDDERHASRPLPQDEPSPEVVALFLRPKKGPRASAVVQGAEVAPTAVQGGQGAQADVQAPLDESLIDSLTRIVTEMLQVHVRESVTAAVRALAPRLVVSLPTEGAEGPTGGSQLRTRPSRLQKHD